MALIQHRVNEVFGFEPKNKQVESHSTFAVRQKWPHSDRQNRLRQEHHLPGTPLIQEESKHASLIIMPLNLLQEEQAEKLKTIADANPFVLNGDTIEHGKEPLYDQYRCLYTQ
jgi:hypothetical protein